jgi:glycosyltransferase involved in cell wall biosynthesis
VSPLPGLVVFTPLPPTRSGIADYAAELLPLLAAGQPTVAVVATRRDVVAVPGVEVLSVLDYRTRPALAAWPHLLQLGNSLDAAHVYTAALRRRAVVVLHDPVLHHLVEALTHARGDLRGYEAALIAELGEAGRRIAALRQMGIHDPTIRGKLPLHRQVLERAAGVLVHSRTAAARVTRPGGPPVRMMPHHLSPQVAAMDGVDRAVARQRLGWPAEAPVLLALGHATPAKRIEVVLAAVARLRQAGHPLRYVIGGQADPVLDLPRLISEFGLGDRVTVTGWISEQDFLLHARAADLLVNLRDPSGGESSGALTRASGMGLPALVDGVGPSAEHPHVAWLAPGPDAVPRLAATIAALLADPVALAARGAAGRDDMRRRCTPEGSAAAMLAAVLDWA